MSKGILDLVAGRERFEQDKYAECIRPIQKHPKNNITNVSLGRKALKK